MQPVDNALNDRCLRVPFGTCGALILHLLSIRGSAEVHIRMARPRRQVDTLEVLRLRLEGQSFPFIARQMNLGLATTYRAYRSAWEALRPFQNCAKRRLEVQQASGEGQ